MNNYTKMFTTNIDRLLGDSNEIKLIVGCILAFFGGIFDGRSEIIIAIVLIYLADFLSGITKQFFKDKEFIGWEEGYKNIKSSRIFKGIIKLFIYGVFLIIGRGMDIMLMTNTFFLSLFFVFIFLTDSISVLENLRELGFDVPVQVVDYLKKYLDKILNKTV